MHMLKWTANVLEDLSLVGIFVGILQENMYGVGIGILFFLGSLYLTVEEEDKS